MEETPILPRFPMGKREAFYAVFLFFINLLLWDSLLYGGGFNLGFSLGILGILGTTAWYLKSSGARFGGYNRSLLILTAVIAAGYARSGDETLKVLLLPPMTLGASLAFLLAAGQNRRDPGTLGTLLDSFRGIFPLGFGSMGPAVRGMRMPGSAEKKQVGPALLGLLLAVPVVGVLIFLLTRADAAFAAIFAHFPKIQLPEPILDLIFGAFFGLLFYAHGLGLKNRQPPEPAPVHPSPLKSLTVNILLGAACAVYAVFFLSQFAYLSGGFAGILPEGFTAAEYARRGFFEMAWLGALNLCLMVLALKPGDRVTKWLSLALGAVTVVLCTLAAAKMVLYITRFGLTRLRVITMAFMVFLGAAAVFVSIRLFRKNFGYMKGAVLAALILGAALLWADVDRVVADYNVRAYESGSLETIDLEHLGTLGDGALPALKRLSQTQDKAVAREAGELLRERLESREPIADFRFWNLSRAIGDRQK